MAWWSFGSKRRKSKVKKSELIDSTTVLDEKRAAAVSPVKSPRLSRAISPKDPDPFSDQFPFGAVPYELQPAGPPPVLSSSPIQQSIAPQPPIHSSSYEPVFISHPQASTAPSQSLAQSPPQSPEPPAPKSPELPTAKSPEPQKAGRRSSAEDITALPSPSRKIERNSHLGTVPESDVNIIAGAANTPGLVKRSSTKRRTGDQTREDKVRELIQAIPATKRSGRESPQVFRRDSKRLREDLDRGAPNPTSSVSLPAARSNRSSMTGMSDTHRFDVGAVDILSPRPTLRYSLHGQYASSAMRSMAPSRADSKRAAPSFTRKDLKGGKTIDDLADDMDSGGLRELMERDQRRRDRKHKSEEARARRRLDRLAARGEKESESTRQARELGGEAGGIEASPASAAGPSGIVREYPSEIHPALRESQLDVVQSEEAAQDPFVAQPQEIAQDPFVVRPEEAPQDPFADPTEEATSLQPEFQSPPTEESPFADPVEERTSNVRDSQATILASMSDRNAQELRDITEAPDTGTQDTESSGRQFGGLAALFRRSIVGSKRSSTDKGREGVSEGSFSNTSRESMTKQSSLLQQASHERTYRQDSTGTPVRTRSKFREDLPESPSQSPEAGEADSVPPTTREAGEPSSAAIPIAAASAIGAAGYAEESSSSGLQAPATELSQSLASVDSEGSWLSGRPRKRTSQQMSLGLTTLGERQPSTSAVSLSTAYTAEEYFTPAEEYPPAMTPTGFFPASDDFESPTRDEEDEEGDEGEGDETIVAQPVQGAVARTPALVQREPRVQSSEGLLTQFDDERAEYESVSDISDGQESPMEDAVIEEAVIEEATAGQAVGSPVAVARQVSHARQISAGSARLLDIPARRESANLSQL